jgi:hypothetical protein
MRHRAYIHFYLVRVPKALQLADYDNMSGGHTFLLTSMFASALLYVSILFCADYDGHSACFCEN